MTARSFRSRPQFTQKQRVTGKIAKEVRPCDGKLPFPPYPSWLCHVRFQFRHPDNRSPRPTAPCYPKWHCRRTYSGKGDSAVLNLRSYEEFEAEAEAEAKDMTADSTVAEIEASGGTSLGIEVDIRDHEAVEAMVARVV